MSKEFLRSLALRSLGNKTSLPAAMKALKFVQYDPIRAPVRAEDLTLFNRVEKYRAGDIWDSYKELDLEESHFYAYGVMFRDTKGLLFPRCDEAGREQYYEPKGVDRDILESIRAEGPMDSLQVRAKFKANAVPNEWGGYSAPSAKALERLHHYGFLRVAGRKRGLKIYEAQKSMDSPLLPERRLELVTEMLASLLAPVPERSLRDALARVRFQSEGIPWRPQVIDELREAGRLDECVVDRTRYLWPAGIASTLRRARSDPELHLLGPFDPVVWDRRRFSHLWGWNYRLEAYLPKKRRRLGYYALPMIYGDDAIGWVNFSPSPKGAFAASATIVNTEVDPRNIHTCLSEVVERLGVMAGRTLFLG